MPVPDLYPSSSTPYDQNEDFAARTLGEAIVSRILSYRCCPKPAWESAKHFRPFQTDCGCLFLPRQSNSSPPNGRSVCVDSDQRFEVLRIKCFEGCSRCFRNFVFYPRVRRDVAWSALRPPPTNHLARKERPYRIPPPPLRRLPARVSSRIPSPSHRLNYPYSRNHRALVRSWCRACAISYVPRLGCRGPSGPGSDRRDARREEEES